MTDLTLRAGDVLLAAIKKHQRKRETLEALFLRMLQQRNRREDVARAQRRKSLARKLQWHESAKQREDEAVDRLRRELDELAATE